MNILFFLDDKLIFNDFFLNRESYENVKKELKKRNVKFEEKENKNKTYKKLKIENIYFEGLKTTVEFEYFKHYLYEGWKNEISLIFSKKIKTEKMGEIFEKKGFEKISSIEMTAPKGISTQYKNAFLFINCIEYCNEDISRIIVNFTKKDS